MCLAAGNVVLPALRAANSASQNPLARFEGPLRGRGKEREKGSKEMDERMRKNIPEIISDCGLLGTWSDLSALCTLLPCSDYSKVMNRLTPGCGVRFHGVVDKINISSVR